MFSCVPLGKEQAWGLAPNVPESGPYDEIESEERSVCGRWQTRAVQVCHVKPPEPDLESRGNQELQTILAHRELV